MPIPRVRPNENEDDYVGRCMSATAEDEGSRQQKLAICFDTFRRRNESEKEQDRDLKDTLREALDV